MRVSTISFKQLSILLPLLFSIPLNTVASELNERGGCGEDDILATDDGPTSDKAPGLGVEFESSSVEFTSQQCKNKDKKETDDSKKAVVGGRKGDDWMLTADTTNNIPGILVAEYILDGTKIKIDKGAAGPAAKAVADDMTKWNPSTKMSDKGVTVDKSSCTDWEITKPTVDGGIKSIPWAMQVTAPMPLEAINELFSKALSNKGDVLLPSIRASKNKVHVTKEFFQSSPNGISSDSVKDDVLGFFSLVISYAKAASENPSPGVDESPKTLTSIMPRTDFTTIFGQVKSAVSGDLYSLVKVLACYKDYDGDIDLDSDYCDGSVDNPQPKKKMDDMKFAVRPSSGSADPLSVKDWVNSISDGTTPDKLTVLDQKIDGQIGGLGKATENVLNTQRAVPLFEFRDLAGIKAADMEGQVTKVENAIVDYHKKYASAPRMIKKATDAKFSHIKRKRADACAPNTASGTVQSTAAPSTTTPPAPSCSLQNQDPDEGIDERGCICSEGKTTSTLPLLTVKDATIVSQSCSYTAWPATKVSNPISVDTQTWTNNCQACTLKGGIADIPSCTSVPNCYPTSGPESHLVALSKNGVNIGDAFNKDNGADLSKNVFKKLQALCPDDAKTCDHDKDAAVIKDVPTIAEDSEFMEQIGFTIQDSTYEDTKVRDQMLAAGVASWIGATSKNCKEIEYEAPEDLTGTNGCGKGPIERRNLTTRAELDVFQEKRGLAKRTPCTKRDPQCGYSNDPECHYSATLCTAPDHITVVFPGKSGPYANSMDIAVDMELEHQGSLAALEFVCDFLVPALTGLAMAALPETAPEDITADLDIEATCGELKELMESNSKRGLGGVEAMTTGGLFGAM